MRRPLALAVALVALPALSAAAGPAPQPQAAAPQSAQAAQTPAPQTPAAEPSAPDGWLPQPVALSCQITSCSGLPACPCHDPVNLSNEACEDENGRLWYVGHCSPFDPLCQSAITANCS
jgi:hypothetical protein